MQANSIDDGVFGAGGVMMAMTQSWTLIRKRARGCCHSLVSETKWPLDKARFRPHKLNHILLNQCFDVLAVDFSSLPWWLTRFRWTSVGIVRIRCHLSNVNLNYSYRHLALWWYTLKISSIALMMPNETNQLFLILLLKPQSVFSVYHVLILEHLIINLNWILYETGD